MIRLILTLSLTLAACTEDPLGGERVPADAEFEGGRDAGRDADASSDTPYDCSAIADEPDWQLCGAEPGGCRAVFLDGAGCYEVCASVGLGCLEVWENID